MTTQTESHAIFSYRGEFAVAHLGTAKVCGQELFQTVWVVDSICPTMEQASQCQKDLIKATQVRNAQILADMAARARRR